jgi:hypothetical protein
MAKVTKKSANLFSTATSLEVAPKKSKADTKDKIEIKGLEKYATIASLMTNLETVAKTLEGEVKDQMRDVFTRQNNKRPENFRGIEGHASASCEMRKRTIKSALSDDEVESLEKDGIAIGREVTIPARFIINPAFAEDMTLLQKVSDALQKIPGLPENFILQQAEQSHRVVTDETLNQVCAKGLIKRHFEKVATMAIKPKLETELDIDDVLESVRKLVSGEEEETE